MTRNIKYISPFPYFNKKIKRACFLETSVFYRKFCPGSGLLVKCWSLVCLVIFLGVFGPRYLSTYLKFTENMAILKLSLQFQKTWQSYTPTTIHTSKQLESQLAKWRKIYIRTTRIFIFRCAPQGCFHTFLF